MNIEVAQYPDDAAYCVAFDADAAYPDDYRIVRDCMERYGTVFSLNDVREFEGKIFTELDILKKDYHAGRLDFGWYMTKGHVYGDLTRPSACMAPTEMEIVRWEEEHERHCTMMVYPCGFRDNQSKFEQLFFARESNPSGTAKVDWKQVDFHNFPITQHWGVRDDSFSDTEYNVRSIAKAEANLNAVIENKGVFIDFVHWHWLGDNFTKNNSWESYKAFLKTVSKLKECCQDSLPRVIEYLVMRKQINISKKSDGYFCVELSPLENHRVDFKKLNQKLTFVLPGLKAGDSIIVNEQTVELTSGKQSRACFSVSPRNFPLEIKHLN